MIDLIYYKNKYFENYCVISNNYLLDDIRNNGLKDNKQIREDNIKYSSIDSIDLLKIVCDKVFFYKVETQSIKNMLYQRELFYQDFKNESQIESYLYRLINEEVNRVLIFINNFDNKNCPNKITNQQKEELINNMDNDIIYLSDNIILLRYQSFLPWLWECKINPFDKLKNLSLKIYSLENKWNFSNLNTN